MSNLFQRNITKSNKNIRDSRAERLAKAAERAQRTLIDQLEKELDSLDDRRETLEDLSPDTELSLQPIKGEFNAENWVKELQTIQINIANKKLELELARATYKKYFTEISDL